MNTLRHFRLYPQEITCGVFLLGMIAWFVGVRGFSEPLVWGFVAQFGIGAMCVWRAGVAGAVGGWERARLLFGVVVLGVSYYLLGISVPLLGTDLVDVHLQQIDVAIFGTQPALLLEPLTRTWLTEILSACYLLYYPWLGCSIFYYSTRDLDTARAFTAGAFTILGLGCILYATVPATGPCFHDSIAGKFSGPLSGGPLFNFTTWLVAAGCNRVDAFPSIHCASTIFLLHFEVRRSPLRFRLLLIPAIGLWIATVYLRYHYFTDLLVGILVSCIGIRLSVLRLR